MEIQQKSEYAGCNNCKYTNVDARDYPCNECNKAIITFDHYKPMTNADRMRNMTDEELADILIDFCACDVCEHHTEYNEYESCSFGNICVKEYAKAITQKWLQAEVEEGE